MANYKCRKAYQDIHHIEADGGGTKKTRLGDASEEELKRILHKDFKTMSRMIDGAFDQEYVNRAADKKPGTPAPKKPAATSGNSATSKK